MYSGQAARGMPLARKLEPTGHRAARMPKSDPSGLAPDRAATALIVLDLISDFAFDGGAKVARAALPVAKRIARLKARAKAAGAPVIYVNDGLAADDYCVLKPKHSGFYATPLDTLLGFIGAKQLILTGVSSHQCVLFTANDAYVRDLELSIPRDCISARNPRDTKLALEYFTRVLGADVRTSAALRFDRA
jgi:nicotinamidase-related amidase